MLMIDLVRRQLYGFIVGEVSLDQFEDWLVASSWNMHLDASPEVQRVVGAIELRMAEYSAGHLDLPALKAELSGVMADGPHVRLVSRNDPRASFTLPADTPVTAPVFSMRLDDREDSTTNDLASALG